MREGMGWEERAWVPVYPEVPPVGRCSMTLLNHPGEGRRRAVLSHAAAIHPPQGPGPDLPILLKQSSGAHTPHLPPSAGTLGSYVTKIMASEGNTWNSPQLHLHTHLQWHSSCHICVKSILLPMLRVPRSRARKGHPTVYTEKYL